jgi:hypothetical protein
VGISIEAAGRFEPPGPGRESAGGSQISTARSAGINSQPSRAPLR